MGIGYDDLNNAGLNIIHMAAQSDSPKIIVYFKEKYNFDLFQNDFLKNNALHWACSSGSKAAFDYLMLYINNVINSVNNQGQTSLHTTILTSGSISTIKKLIKKGIDINIKDNNGLTALDLVKNKKKYEKIEKVIFDYTNRNFLGLNQNPFPFFLLTSKRDYLQKKYFSRLIHSCLILLSRLNSKFYHR